MLKYLRYRNCPIVALPRATGFAENDSVPARTGRVAVILALLLVAVAVPSFPQTRDDEASPLTGHSIGDPGYDSLEFYVLANTQFTLLHELGHALIHTLQLPVLGREEDAADTLAIAGLLIADKEKLEPNLLERLIVISDEWLLEWNENEDQPAYWDSHSLEIQRFYNIVCLIYGSDTERFKGIAFGTALPVERSFDCQDEFSMARHAVEWVFVQYGAGDPQRLIPTRPAAGKVTVFREAPTTPNGPWLAEILERDGLIDRIAGSVDAAFRLPENIDIELVNCTGADAYFHTESKIIVLCWSLLESFLERAKRRAAAGPQSLCDTPIAASIRPSRLGCPGIADGGTTQEAGPAGGS